MDVSNKLNHLHVLIMAGGSGTRFWPKSRQKKPKQLLSLWDSKSLLEHTVERFKDVSPKNQRWIVTTKQLVESSKNAIKESSIHFLGEPAAKNTAPCILWGVLEIMKNDPEAIVAVMPADHYIGNEKAFIAGLQNAYALAQNSESIVILGIKPDRPETGYGYIEFDSRSKNNHQAHSVIRFVEKPDLKTAAEYVRSGRYLWNAGMFIFKAKVGLNAFELCMPELLSLFQNNDIEKTYTNISTTDAISFDYGIMEACSEKNIPVNVIPLECGWNDVGSFTALEDINCAQLGDVVTLDANCNIVQSDTGLVALLGVQDLVVVRDQDVVLVASKDRAQDIKALLDKVKQKFPEKL